MTQIMRLRLAVLLLLLFSWIGASTAANQVTELRIAKRSSGTRIVFNLKRAIDYKSFTLRYPDRLVVDLRDAFKQFDLKSVSLDDSDVKKIRFAKRKNNDLRFVFELKQPQKMNAFVLSPSHGYLYRLVIDLTEPSNQKAASHKASVVKTSEPPATNIIVPYKNALRDIIIVIDPGHGGKDPGAMGARGTREKHVVLAISKRLQQLINRQPGMRAVLTRSTDKYIGLRKRLAIARDKKADLFIAIHADAFKNRRSRGASVFALSERGASSEAARWLAEQENYSELGGVDLNDKSQVLRSVLLDLSQTATISSSLSLGDEVLKQLGKIAVLHNNSVEQARFVVLKSPDIPSLLIETGFISNRYEEKLLKSYRYQTKLAQAIVTGVKRYFAEHPLAGSLLAAKQRARRHKVASGESVAELAKRYRIPTNSIRKLNQLGKRGLRAGEWLYIPRREDV